MPLLKQNLKNTYQIAKWHITEPLPFFESQLNIFTDIKYEKRKIEHLAGRLLLKKLWADFPLENISKNANNKPELIDGSKHFSISHSYPYAAAYMSEETCGIDLQVWHPKITVLQDKFLSAFEKEIFNNDTKLLTLAWCAKEAAYKKMGKRGIDFIHHLPIQLFSKQAEYYKVTIQPPHSVFPESIILEGHIYDDYALCFTL